MNIRKNKVQLNTTVSPYTMKRLLEMVDGNEMFSSRSDAVEKSLDMMYFNWKHSVRVKNYEHSQAVAVLG